tara:strand:- start:499 stop:4767 length:4269 start_codon:yes stop_codon:yes gene_type:complete
MANEYLDRKPISTGNRKVWTWSAWVKRNQLDGLRQGIFTGLNDLGNIFSGAEFATDNGILWYEDQNTTNVLTSLTDRKFTDVGSWIHLVFVFNSTAPNATDRIKIYVNGSLEDSYENDNRDGIAQNMLSRINDSDYTIAIGGWGTAAPQLSFKGQMSDVFFVDGQELTPDVFGFYKDGDGYVSVGPTNATDFRPGQWMPLSPSVIKKSIERSGGFGVNGFYLPMNDSSNPGADFHCDTNSIITLKGEDLPQPRNGAPTTSDAYVSQLRQETGELSFEGVVKFDGNGDYLEIPDSDDFDFGSGDFTVEAFVEGARGGTRIESVVLNQSVSGATSNSAFYFGAGTDGTSLYLSTSGTSWTNFVECSTSSTLHDNGFHHVAWQRRSDTLEIYVDGILQPVTGGNASFTGTIFNSSRVVDIGRQSTSGSNFNGMISNLRVVKGTAVYTGNFTPPTEPLTNITDTKLLCCQSSTDATAATVTPGTITANGDVFATKNELTGYMVLAVPGISTSTSANLVTNGHFDTNTTGWTAVDATITWSNGRAQTNRTGGTGYTAYYQITGLSSGQRYTVSGLLDSTGTGNRQDLRILDDLVTSGGSVLTNVNGIDDQIIQGSSSFTATGSTHYIYTVSDGGGTGFFDNIVVKQEDAPRDYSADIRGSGTNKTLTASGGAGVGYELGGYYGSAMTFDGTGDALEVSNNSDFNFSDGSDFTIELWLYRKDAGGNDGIIGIFENTLATRRTWQFEQRANQAIRFEWWTDGSSGTSITTSSNRVPTDQWSHICAERSGDVITLYVNGVAEGVNTSAGSIYNNTVDPLRIGAINQSISAELRGNIQDIRIYKNLAKYKGGFNVPKPHTPVGIEAFRTTADICKNNFATLNYIARGSKYALSDGNLKFTNSTSNWTGFIEATHGFRTGKWYWEVRMDASSPYHIFGIVNNTIAHHHINDAYFYGMTYQSDGRFYAENNGGSSFSSGNTTAQTIGDVVMLAVDMDAKKMWLGVNGAWLGSGNPSTGDNANWDSSRGFTDGRDYTPIFLSYGSSGLTINFGQNPSFSGQATAGTNADDSGKGLFKYAPPTGFLALCEDNLPTPAIADPGKHFKTVLYRGDGNNGHLITGVGFQPDLVWLKERGPGSSSHQWHDSVRGAGNALLSNATNAESYSATYLYSLDSDGFTLGNSGGVNASTDDYVAWCWKAGGAAVTNNDGTITSQVSANQTAGFSIVSYTGDGNNGDTVGHGLGVEPKLVISKSRTATGQWLVSTNGISDSDLFLETTGTQDGFTRVTAYSSTTLTLNSSSAHNSSGVDYVSYCWAEIEGFSKFGRYEGNASTDGPFIYCGFKPAFIMIKNIDTAGGLWIIGDNARVSTNPINGYLHAESNANEYGPLNGDAEYTWVDFLSNGFKLRQTGDSINAADTYIFMAFAESPFQTANAK